METPPERPRTIEEIGFRRRAAVRWFSPAVLARSGIKVVLAGAFGDYLDKRELQHSMPGGLTLDLSKRVDDLWLDFVADTGDGFDATYSVAWAVSQRSLAVPDPQSTAQDPRPDLKLERGQVLVLGGDEVYPVAKVEDYEDRFVGPFKAALPWTDAPHPTLLAIPGNHDWYDGLTGFMRLFGQGSWIGGRVTSQTRSYFAAALPGRWWLWGIDIQSDAYLDKPQINYFESVRRDIKAGDGLILCTAKPSWAHPDEHAYRNLKFVEEHLVPEHCPAVLMLSGDSHHYARYESETEVGRRQKITAGGGGAFLSATHDLEPTVNVPVAGESDVTSPYRLRTRYPDEGTSRRLSWRALLLPKRNPSLIAVTATVQVLLFLSNRFGLRTTGGPKTFKAAARQWSWADLCLGRLRYPLTVVIVFVLCALLIAFAKKPRRPGGRWSQPVRVTAGLAHAAAHVAAAAAVAWLAIHSVWFEGFWFAIFVVGFIAVVGGAVGGVVLGAYLVASLKALHTHSTEVFSAIRNEDYKNFLRIRIDASTGQLTVYALGIDKVAHAWSVDPGNPDNEASHLEPGQELRCRLVDLTTMQR
jgi:hypothetical protein